MTASVSVKIWNKYLLQDQYVTSAPLYLDSAGQDLPSVYRIPNIHYVFTRACHQFLFWAKLIQSAPYRYVSFLPSIPRSSEGSLSFMLFDQSFVCVSSVPYNMQGSPISPPQVNYLDKIWAGVKTTQFLVMKLFPILCYFLLTGFKY
jgi:hypothetical protein